jgi:alkyl sulfatase BDS1-like metallo-beta-lactamase superfamily hydrolase
VGSLNETIDRWGDRAEVLFAPHNWPVWGSARIVEHLAKYRDTVKYIHDQTLRLANQGYTMEEIAEQLELPGSLSGNASSRGYYGTVSHNSKAVYNFYLGYFDGNPAHLNPLPPEDAAKKYVEFMGGPEETLRKARLAFERGEYRWVAEVVNHVVFPPPPAPAASPGRPAVKLKPDFRQDSPGTEGEQKRRPTVALARFRHLSEFVHSKDNWPCPSKTLRFISFPSLPANA